MSFTITKNLDQLPSYPMLSKLAEENDVRVTGNPQAGSFSGRGVAGEYRFSDGGMNGQFTGHSVTGEFSFVTGQATVTVIEKPFWLPESLLKQKISEGLDRLCKALV